MRIKICGITNVADAVAAVAAGADAIGLNFVSGPRRIKPAAATAILQCLPPLVTPVALVRLRDGHLPDDLLELFGEFWVSHLQLYGELSAENLAGLLETGFRPMPVLRVRGPDFAAQAAEWLPDGAGPRPAAVVLDACDPDREGGTGTAFNWDWVAEAGKGGRLSGWPPIILAGGLTPANVGDAIRVVQPYGVDVSSGVELSGSPGTKDAGKMRAFVQNARLAEMSLTPTITSHCSLHPPTG